MELTGNGGAARTKLSLGWKRLNQDETWSRPAVNDIERQLLLDAVFPEQARGGNRSISEFIVVDPSARPGEGRHWEVARRLKAYADRLKVPMSIIGHRDALTGATDSSEWADGSGRVFNNGVFIRHTVYDYADMPADALAESVADLRESLQWLLSGAPFHPSRHIFVPFTDAVLLALFVDLFASIPAERRPFLHLATPWDEERMPNADRISDPKRVVQVVRELNREAHRIFLYAGSRELARRLSRKLGNAFQPLEMPPAPELAEDATGRADRFTVGVLGAPRLEKGFEALPEIVAAHNAASLNPRGTRFIVQHYRTRVSTDEWIKLEAAAGRLRGIPERNVTLLEEMLPSPAYYGVVQQLDAVLLAYDPAIYAERDSSVLVDALAAGKLVFTREGNFLSVGSRSRILAGNEPRLIGEMIADAAAIGDRHRQDAAIAKEVFWSNVRPSRFFAQLLLGPSIVQSGGSF
jgi:hypothetical protein